MFLDKEQVNSLILELGLATQEDFDIAEQEVQEINSQLNEGEGLEVNNILIKKGIINEDELREVQSKVTNTSFINLKDREIEDEILFSIPEPITRKYKIIAFDKNADVLKIAVLDLAVLDKIDFLKKNVALKVIPYLSDEISINQNILKYQELLKDGYGKIIQDEFLAFQTISEDMLKNLSREEKLELARDKKINYIFELFLKHALLQKASIIHIEPQRDKTLIKYRIGGKLYTSMILPKNAATIFNLKIKVFTGEDIDKKLSHFSIGFDGKEVVFQVNKIQSLWGERIVLNILQQGESDFSLESLGFHGKALDILYSEIEKKEKTILITGDQDSGKTTTFYTFLDLLNNTNLAIGTIENSIGFQMNGINQVVTNKEIGFGISQGLDKLEKQNLDVLGIDKIEDLKNLKGLFKVLWVDRFNFAILDTQENSGIEIIFKLKDLEINPAVIVASLSSIISQKLISALNENKKEEYYLSVDEIKKISKKRDVDMEKVMSALVEEDVLKDKKSWTEVPFFKLKVAKKKNQVSDDINTKKVMVSEVFKISLVVKEMILNNATKKDIENQVSKEGILTISEDILFKAVQGLISIENLL
ncbi:MAG: Flp pilus assembly complex ATPase component TadA [Candidatus Pacebacteria bacterium]|nr:Flp pilus assembly complex ATPase component TadA [Candidatus Paceibacterota bacterium]